MTTDNRQHPSDRRRWLHGWAVLTVCATVVLLGLGSAVTTFKAGMADRAWPTRPDALAHATPEQMRDFRWVIEHSHRLAGYVVGCCTIVLAVWLWLREPRRQLAWLGLAALAGVSIQGVVGGLRVLEHARWGLELRILHGCFAQVVLAVLVSLAVLTSRAGSAPAGGNDRLRRWSLLAVGLVYLQIVLGVLLRHTYHPVWQRLHLLTAFAAVAVIVWLIKLAFASGAGRPLTVAAAVLGVVVGLQVMLGAEALLMQWTLQLTHRIDLPELLPLTAGRTIVRTAHVLGGSLVFALTVVVALLAWRRPASAVHAAVAPDGRLEEAA